MARPFDAPQEVGAIRSESGATMRQRWLCRLISALALATLAVAATAQDVSRIG
jgi:hypothetical protein